MGDVYRRIAELVHYGETKGLLTADDRIYTTNLLLDVLNLDSYEAPEEITDALLAEILDALLDYAAEQNLLPANTVVYRDLFDTRLMNCLLPRPSEVRERFRTLAEEDIEKATDWFYEFSKDTNYIRRDRVAKDRSWIYNSAYGPIDITINLSKPEKDPVAIAQALKMKQSSYPLCQLCKEAEGYAGRVNYPARQTHRLIPLTLTVEDWYFQYSPYTYYNEHSIIFSSVHRPMAVSREGITRLLEFITSYPHYFIGSNADLPIVGGSILTHDHFQGGRYTFAMDNAEVLRRFELPNFPSIEASTVKWPLSVLRLKGKNTSELVEAATGILALWRDYSDPAADIHAYSDDTPHNTITPIARRDGEAYVLDLVLRNNRTTADRPLGLFHPRPEFHHIKKENIGLIEVMGLAVLPARLLTELEAVAECLVNGSDALAKAETAAHANWIAELREQYDTFSEENILELIQEETGKVFVGVLEDAGVYKQTPEGQAALDRFIERCQSITTEDVHGSI